MEKEALHIRPQPKERVGEKRPLKYMRNKRMVSKKGQVVMEYAIIIILVAAALGLMQVYLKRGIQAGIKIASDELGSQVEAEEKDPTKGFTKFFQSRSYTSPDQLSVRVEKFLDNGDIERSVDETIYTEGSGKYLGRLEKK